MCIICYQYQMYGDRSEIRRMLRKAREEKAPITEEHLKELEYALGIDEDDVLYNELLSKMDLEEEFLEPGSVDGTD